MDAIVEDDMGRTEGKMGNEWKMVLRMEEDLTKEGCLRNQHVITHTICIFLGDHQLT